MRTLNFGLLARIIAVILLIVSGFMLVPGLIALFMADYAVFWSFLGPILGTAVFASLVLFLVKSPSQQIGPREGYLLVSLSWLFVTLLGSLPYMFSGFIPSFTDAFFETMSGFTTTGATILPDIEILPKALLFWRSLTHWLGGMGVIALTVAILPLFGVSGMQLLRAETPGPDVDKVTPKLAQTAKLLWLIYVILTTLQTFLLMLGGMDFFESINHSFATMATGGFSTKNLSLAYWDSAYIQWIVTLFMFLAGVNFVLYFRLVSGRGRIFFQNTEFKAYALIVLLFSFSIAFYLWQQKTYQDFWVSLRHASFQVVSILTTTGFASQNFGLWPGFAQTMLMLLMFFGASTGSTAGGIKVLRWVALGKLARHEVYYMLHPKGVFALRLNGQPVRKDLLYPMAGFVILYFLILFASSVVISLDGHDTLTSFTTALASLGNIGPGLAAAGPAYNFAFFSDWVTWFLSLLMMLGRLEIYTVAVLFIPLFWRR